MYSAPQPVQERNCLLQSLGYTRNKDVLNRVLNLALSPRLRDQAAVLIHLSVVQRYQITIGTGSVLLFLRLLCCLDGSFALETMGNRISFDFQYLREEIIREIF